MSVGVVILLIVVILLVLVGIGVGLYFILRKKDSGPSGGTGPSGGSGLPGPIGFTGPFGHTGPPLIIEVPTTSTNCPGCTSGPLKGSTGTLWINYTGGIDGNDVTLIGGVTSLENCQLLCNQNTNCQMVHFDSPNSNCLLKKFNSSTTNNISILTPNLFDWFHYTNAELDGNDQNDFGTLQDEDTCRLLCKNFILSDSKFHNQAITEFNTSTKNCLCKSSTRVTLQSYRVT